MKKYQCQVITKRDLNNLMVLSVIKKLTCGSRAVAFSQVGHSTGANNKCQQDIIQEDLVAKKQKKK